MSHEFQSAAELREFCRAELARRGIGAELAANLTDAVADELTETRMKSPPRGGFGLMLPIVCWVIRDDDLALLESLWAGLTAAAGADFFQQSPSASVLTGIVAAVFKTVRKAAKKGVSLNPLQYRLLLGLKRSERGWTVTEATTWVNATLGSDGTEMTEDSICAELKALAKVRVRDGSVIALAMEDHDGRWSAAGL